MSPIKPLKLSQVETINEKKIPYDSKRVFNYNQNIGSTLFGKDREILTRTNTPQIQVNAEGQHDTVLTPYHQSSQPDDSVQQKKMKYFQKVLQGKLDNQ